MGRLRVLLAAAALVCVCSPQATAAAVTLTDVSSGYFARQQVFWAVNHGWMNAHHNGTFKPGRAATRASAARVLANLNLQQTGNAVAPDPYAQAVDAGWIGAGAGPSDTITQL